MTEPKCELCGERHHPKQAHRWPAINTGAINNVRGSAINGSEAGDGESASCSEETVAEVERGGPEDFQRGLRDDDAKPVGVSGSLRGEEPADKAGVEDDGLERGLDSRRRGKTLNRRSREAYNAYMKEYMRKRRA